MHGEVEAIEEASTHGHIQGDGEGCARRKIVLVWFLTYSLEHYTDCICSNLNPGPRNPLIHLQVDRSHLCPKQGVSKKMLCVYPVSECVCVVVVVVVVVGGGGGGGGSALLDLPPMCSCTLWFP